MKELNTFRKFLAEGEAKGFTFIFRKGKTGKEQIEKAKAILKDKEISFTSPGDMALDFPSSADKGNIKSILQKNGVTRYVIGDIKEDVSENALGVDKGDGTFEITPDITIMGQKFNFSDICPSAHKLVQNQAIVHQGFSRTAPIVLEFAIKHREFFNLERKALGSMGITVDEYNDDVTRLYTEILNIAEKLGVRKQAKKYMDMHMAKIKDAGFKASEPGGSSDRIPDYKADNDYYMDETGDEEEYARDWKDEQDDLFGKLREVRSRLESEVEGYTDLHENDVVLEAFLGEEELDEKQKYADDQLKFKKGDTVYFKNVKGGKNLPMTITGPGKFMKSNRLGAGGKEVVFPVKGGPGGKGMYAADDLVKENLNEEKYIVTISKNGTTTETNVHNTKEDAEAQAKKINGGFMDRPDAKFKAVVSKDLKENLEEEIKMVEPQRGHNFYKLNKDVELELQTGSTSVTNAPGVLLQPVFGKKIIAKKGQYIISFFGQLFYVDMDEKFATKVPKHEDSDNMKNLRGALVPVDIAPNFNPGWKSYLNEPLEEAAKPDEKAIKAQAAKLMKDPKYKARYKGKKGVEFVKTAMADAEKQLKGK